MILQKEVHNNESLEGTCEKRFKISMRIWALLHLHIITPSLFIFKFFGTTKPATISRVLKSFHYNKKFHSQKYSEKDDRFAHSILQEFSHKSRFLGGLSLHLNHLIASRTANYDWPFGTLPFGLFGQIWTHGTLRHILGPILVIFEICQFLTIPGPFEYFSENGWFQKIKVFSMKEWSLSPLLV